MSAEERTGVPVVAIVDDEEDIITYLRVALEDAGYRVVATADASEAMSLLGSGGPDLVCLDLLMPEQTGLSLYASLCSHAELSTVPVVIMSGLTSREGLPAILEEAGGLPEPASFIEKPVDIEEFLATVEEILGPWVGTSS